MATQWFYEVMGDVLGPFSPAELKKHAALGNVHQDSLVRKGTGGQWVPAWRVRGLFDDPAKQRTSPAESDQHSVVRPIPDSHPVPLPQRTQQPTPVVVEPQPEPVAVQEPAQRKGRSKWFLRVLVLALLIPTYSWLHNNGLRGQLHSCPSYGIVEADVYYDGFFSSDVVVFDLKDGGSSTARRIDPVHLLLQFASKLDFFSVQSVVLARNGRQIFTVSSTALRPLADSYAAGDGPWAFTHLPESVRKMSGLPAYGEWTGGWLGVLQKQMEDVNDFIREWTGY